MGEDFTVTVTDPERKAEFEAIFGTAAVHVRSPLTKMVNLPGHPGALIYELDLDLITVEQRERLVAHIAARFDVPESQVEAGLDEHGVPILASDCSMSVVNPLKWF